MKKTAEGKRPLNENINLGDNGYIFVINQVGDTLAHPTNEGMNVWDLVDSKGLRWIQETVKVANKGGDFVTYEWPLPNTETPAKKIVYAKLDPHWGWVIGASTYTEEFDRPADYILKLTLIVMGITFALGIIIIWKYASGMARPINQVAEAMVLFAEGDLSRENIDIKSTDEIGKLASAMNQMHNKIKKYD